MYAMLHRTGTFTFLFCSFEIVDVTGSERYDVCFQNWALLLNRWTVYYSLVRP